MNKRLLIIVGVLTISVAIPLTVYLVQQQQQYKSKAAVPGGEVKVTLSPASGTVKVGEEFPVKINMDGGGKEINTIDLSLFYRYTESPSELDIVDKDTTRSGINLEQNQALLGAPYNASYVDNLVQDDKANKVISIKLSIWASLANGITTTAGQPITLATLYLKGVAAVANSINLEFDSSNNWGNNVVNIKGTVDRLDSTTLAIKYPYSIVNPPPTITSLSPNSAKNNTPITINIIGRNFLNPTVKLTKAGNPDIPGTNLTSGTTQITATFDITGKATGTWNLVVINSDGQRGNAPFEITEDTTINFKVKFQAVAPLTLTSAASAKEVTFTLRKINGGTKTEVLSTQVTTTAETVGGTYTNKFVGTVNLSNLVTSTDSYEVRIKGPKHLAKNFSNLAFNPGQTNAFDWSDVELPTGDIGGSSANNPPDNKINGTDYSLLLDDYQVANLRSDLNYDGRVNGTDYSFLLDNYQANIRTGDL